ncbi:FkbM family methyltransferase [Aquibium carbonis]|uniref:FkbM family methyltransferase n=1 Tax=Aquibium carbonis TaxID=2495581 RepID=A0A429Z079_9HYPH|nr:FkbM family methyltransferase [Aquibium carbonis]RST87117.1 FkbM family methyltransferase [Aquibium carbonis]
MSLPLAALDTTTAFGKRPPSRFARLIWALTVSGDIPHPRRKAIRKHFGSRLAGPFDVTAGGIAFRAYPAENRDDRMLVGHGVLPEAEEHALIEPLLKPGMVFVDIGANVGTYSLHVATKAGPGARIIAFEPHPRTFAKLAYNLDANGAGNVAAQNLAIAGETGTMELYSDGGGNIGHASLLREGAGAVRSTQAVPVAPLASVLARQGVPNVDLLKIDVEGFEDRALLPLFEQAPERLWPKAILIETVLSTLWLRDCIGFLADRGYRRGGETAENVLLLRGVA